MVENPIKIKSEIMINVDVSVKIIKYVKKMIFGILLHVVAKIENIGMEAKSNNEEAKTVPTNFNEKGATVKDKISIFYLHFYQLV